MILRGRLSHNESLARYNTWRVGGNASRFYKPTDQQDLQDFLKTIAPEEPLLWIGLGSNLLVRDAGFAGTVIHTLGCLKEIKQIDDSHIFAQAGVSCAQLARFCARQGLEGLEFLAGVPGSVGGALALNAGCHGSETWEYVVSVETINRSAEIQSYEPQDFSVQYRFVNSPREEWYLGAIFKLNQGTKENSLSKIKKLLDHRSATQPTGDHTCGSVFRNPPDDYAGRLIEEAGLKGLQVGGAKVSPKHANFIVNDGNATAADIEALIIKVADCVESRYGIRLIPEVHIVGDA